MNLSGLHRAWHSLALVLCTAVTLCACQGFGSGTSRSSTVDSPGLSIKGNWLLGEFTNYSERATASQAMVTLLETHLRQSGIASFVPEQRQAHYRIQGSIEEWTYLTGAASRPVISLNLAIHDAQSNVLLWAAESEKQGGRRESLTLLADRMLGKLVRQIPMQDKRLPAPRSGVLVNTPDPQDYLKMIAAPPGSGFRSGLQMPGPPAIRQASSWAASDPVSTPRSLTGKSVAFYYGSDPAINVLGQFDRLVLEPDNIDTQHLAQLGNSDTSTFAYLSIGEVGPNRAYRHDIHEDWILGSNPAWDSQVLDLTNMDVRALLLSRVGLFQRAGYAGVFLDTMDSYQLHANTAQEKQAQQQGIVSLVQSIAVRYPGMRIMVNRGFEVLDEIAAFVEAVAAESLYESWDNEQGSYRSVSDSDRSWLNRQLVRARDILNLDVIVIDYVAPEERLTARRVATDIARDGFIPWVATPSLDSIGVGALEVVPREVLMLYDSRVDGALASAPVHQMLAMPVEYLGYVPVYLDISTQALPSGQLRGRYAGIVTWPSAAYVHSTLGAWLKQQLESQVPVAFFSIPPVPLDTELMTLMGIEMVRELDTDNARVTVMDDMFSPERSLPERYGDVGLQARNNSSDNTVHMRLSDTLGNRIDPVVTGSFGGFAWQPGIILNDVDYVLYWLIDPFRFIRTALQLPDAPQPDITTENGKRLWMAHIDGEALHGVAEIPGRPLGAEVLHEQVFKKYSLPHTVSVVEAEMTQFPEYDDVRERMFDITRRIFAMEQMDIASHTYSLPMNWSKVREQYVPGQFNLNIPGYRFSAERELRGSLDFINGVLAPPDKKAKLMLWSGNAQPLAEDLALLNTVGIPNLNGGSTSISRRYPSLSRVGPMARTVDQYLQVYAPIASDNVFTNGWRGPFDGYRDVIGTFEMTDYPKRLKPISVNYHWYTGTKKASLRALDDVYAWSLAQDIFPTHVSDYVNKVEDFRRVGVARYLDGTWKLTRMGDIRSVRMFGSDRYPDLKVSQGLAGSKRLHDGLYMHTDGRDEITFRTSVDQPDIAYLVSSNGKVVLWQQDSRGLVFQLKAEVPATIELGGISSGACRILAGKKRLTGKATNTGTVVFSFSRKDTGHAFLNCQT